MHPLKHIASSFIVAFAAAGPSGAMAAPVKNIILVHGFFADGSGWQGVANILTRDGFNVTVVQQPETSLADDVKAATQAIDALDGDSILVGHSYGGVVITEAGTHAKVRGLVYVAAYQPEVGESLLDLAKKMPLPGTSPIMSTTDGHLYIDRTRFHASFAADLSADKAKFMALSQVMPAGQVASTAVTQAAWKSKPSWAIVSSGDLTVNPELQRFMSKRASSQTTEIKGSHVAFIVRPEAVAKVIKAAAESATK